MAPMSGRHRPAVFSIVSERLVFLLAGHLDGRPKMVTKKDEGAQ